MADHPFTGLWSYGSLLNDPDIKKDFEDLNIAAATIEIAEQWICDYEGYLCCCEHGVQQRPAVVGSVIRTVPHSGGEPGAVAPVGVVFSFYAVKSN